MIPLLINVEVTGKGAEKAELSINAEDVLVHGKGLAETLSKASLSASSSSPENTLHIISEKQERGGG